MKRSKIKNQNQQKKPPMYKVAYYFEMTSLKCWKDLHVSKYLRQ